MDPDKIAANNVICEVTLADFLKADDNKTDDDFRYHTITLMHNGESHAINDSTYYDVWTRFANQYMYIKHTMLMDDNALMQAQNHKSVRKVLAENEQLISAHKK